MYFDSSDLHSANCKRYTCQEIYGDEKEEDKNYESFYTYPTKKMFLLKTKNRFIQLRYKQKPGDSLIQ
jgi:hypothetical protein